MTMAKRKVAARKATPEPTRLALAMTAVAFWSIALCLIVMGFLW